MTKYSFLNELDQLLQGLDEAERREVLEDYEEHFAFAKRADKSIKDVIASVGTPKEIAQELLGDDFNENATNSNTTHSKINLAGFDLGGFVNNITDSVETLVDNIHENVGERFEFPDEELADATESVSMITEVIEMEGVKNIVVDAKNQKIKISKTHYPTARIRLSRGILRAVVEGDTLKIEAREIKRKFIIGNFINIEMGSKLEIELPATTYELVKAKTANAKIEIDHFEVTELDLETINGRIEAKAIQAKQMQLSTSNGSIEIERGSGNVSVRTTNGGIKVKQLVGTLTARTSNGKIAINDVSRDIIADTTNGKIELENQTITQQVELSTTNSKIEIKLKQKPADAKFELTTTHGKTLLFGNERNYELFGTGENLVDLSTTNGKIEVVVEN